MVSDKQSITHKDYNALLGNLVFKLVTISTNLFNELVETVVDILYGIIYYLEYIRSYI